MPINGKYSQIYTPLNSYEPTIKISICATRPVGAVVLRKTFLTYLRNFLNDSFYVIF